MMTQTLSRYRLPTRSKESGKEYQLHAQTLSERKTEPIRVYGTLEFYKLDRFIC